VSKQSIQLIGDTRYRLTRCWWRCDDNATHNTEIKRDTTPLGTRY